MLFVVHPDDSSTMNAASFRFGAWVRDTSARVTVQGRDVQVWPSGAVADKITLEEGWNTIPFFVESSSGIEETLIRVFRPASLVTPDKIPTRILDTLMTPSVNQAYYGENEIHVSFRGSPGGRASFHISGLTPEPLPMKETGVGRYSGVYRVKSTDKVTSKPVEFRLKGEKGRTKKRNSQGRITVIPDHQPRIAKTTSEHTLVYYGFGGEIFMDLQPGIELELKADLGTWCKVEAGSGHSGYVRKRDVSFLPAGETLDKASMYGITSDEDTNWVYINFNITGNVPFDITHHLDPNRIRLTFFRTHFQNEWSEYPENHDVLDYFDWRQIQDGELQFDFILKLDQSWGFYGKYIGSRFQLAIRKPPVVRKEKPFDGLRIAIDAGHGGDQKGALGATGLMEKDANLVYSYFLKDILEKEGATIVMTRPDDKTMGLQERMDIAVEENAQLFLWMHNNSTGIGRHPEDIKGTSTFFTPLQSKDFAKSIYPYLKDLDLYPEGFIHRSYFMTRQTFMPVILVEGAFLSHPEDEMYLLQDENLLDLANAVADGLREQLEKLEK